MCECVCVCARCVYVCARCVCIRMCVYGDMYACVHVYVCACVHAVYVCACVHAVKSAPSTISLQIKLGGDETTKVGRADKFEGGIVD